MENYQIAGLCLALGLLGGLSLMLQIRTEVRRCETNWRKEIEQVRFQLSDQSSKWIQTARAQESLQTSKVPLHAEVAFPLRAPGPLPKATLWGSNMKAKAIEMVRQGESSSRISAALSLPKPEVEFLMKLERAAAQS